MKLFGIGKKNSKTGYEAEMDRKLMISTMGRDDSNADEYHHPYEPTPYTVLRRLAESGYITGTSKVIDYECGKCQSICSKQLESSNILNLSA